MRRREFLLTGSVFVLSACQMSEPVVLADSGTFRVTSVRVGLGDPDRLQRRLDRWDIGVTKEQFAADVHSAVSRVLTASSKDGTRTVDLSLTLTDVSLDSSIPGMLQITLISPIPYSTIFSTVQITDARTGDLLVSRGFMGDDNPGTHTFSSTVRASFSGGKPAAQAYQDVVQGFADDLARQFRIGFDKTT